MAKEKAGKRDMGLEIELDAIDRCVMALRGLTTDQQKRALEYVANYYDLVVTTR